ncbi:hypothetical protein WH956_000669 [Salmonella enterica]
MLVKTPIIKIMAVIVCTIPTWVNAATIQSKIEYNTHLLSRLVSVSNITGNRSDIIRTPMPTNIIISTKCEVSWESSCHTIHGTMPTGLESTVKFDPNEDFIKVTASEKGIQYHFTAAYNSIKVKGTCKETDHTDYVQSQCSWPGTITLPLTLTLVNSSAHIVDQSVALIVEPGGGNNETDQFTKLTGNIILEDSASNYTSVDVSTSAIDEIHMQWVVKVTEDREGDTGYYYGTLTKTGASVTPIHYSLPADVLNASFSPDALNQNINVQMSGVKTDAELALIYIFHEQTPCDDSPLCNYNLINASTSIVCGDNNAHLTFNRSCSGSSSTTCENGKIGSITGTWGRVNIDTTCAVTVLIPYE